MKLNVVEYGVNTIYLYYFLVHINNLCMYTLLFI